MTCPSVSTGAGTRELWEGILQMESDSRRMGWLAWGHAGAAINLAAKAFSRTDCAYSRFLRDTVHMFAQVAELVEFAH